MEEERGRVNCNRCAHYYVTWDESFPRGCRALGFKSRTLPALVVKNSSGMPCQMYRPKPGPKTGEDGGGGG